MSLNTVYWIRFSLALIMALLLGFLRIWGIPGLILTVLVYAVTHGLFRRLISEDVDSKKILMEGLGTYFLVWLTVWTILYNFLK